MTGVLAGVWGWQELVRRRRENRKTTDSFGLGQDLSEEVGAGGMARRQDGMLHDELPSFFLSLRSSSSALLGLGPP